MADKFILFCLARSGSTTLMRLLNCHPDIRCANEPFNPDNFGGRYFRRVRDLPSLEEALSELWRSHNGIKHVWHPSGWPFTNRRDLNDYILLKAAPRVLFLNRRNILKRVVSSQISEQTRVWAFAGEGERDRLRNFEFKPLDVGWLKRQLDHERESIAQQRQMLVAHGAAYLELWYEELYEADSGTRRKVERLNQVLAFLGGSAITDAGALSKVEELFDPLNAKMNSAETYSKIPGIDEIERRFGSDENGWLFK